MTDKSVKIIIAVVFLLLLGGNIYMANLILGTDTLAEGKDKINAIITDAEQAIKTAESANKTAENAFNNANTALNNSKSTQEQLNQIVVNGDSSVEAAQARVAADGTTAYATLKERLDAENNNVTSQLAEIETQKATKTELATERAERLAEVEVERQRINSFTTMAEGSTTGDAELIDARIGADGITYPNAGEAVRGQYNKLNKNVEDSLNYNTLINNFYNKSIGTSAGKVSSIVNVTNRLSNLNNSFLGDSYKLENGRKYKISVKSGYKYSYAIFGNDYIIKNTYAYVTNDTIFEVTENNLMLGIVLAKTDDSYISVSDSVNLSFELFNDVKEEIEALKNNAKNLLRDKNIVNFGDSIFGNARPPQDVSTELARLTGATVYNCGFGGCRMGYDPREKWYAFSMVKLSEAIANSSWALQDTYVSDADIPTYFSETLTLLKSIDFNTVDIITIAYGTNDWFYGMKPYTDNASQYAYDNYWYSGALRTSIETLLGAYPHLRIFLVTPHYRFFMDADGVFIEDSDTKTVTSTDYGGGSISTKLTDFVDACYNIGKEYHLKVIDNYYDLGINKYNRTQYFPSTDETHHNQDGRNLIAGHLASELF